MTKELDRLSKKELGELFPIFLSEYNPEWISLFQKEKEKIMTILNKDIIVGIEHIGSTAVPSLKAKPTIDILIEIKENTSLDKIKDAFQKLGYHRIAQPENPPPHMMLVKGYTKKGFKGQAYHLHIRYKGDWDEIHFRDYLIKNPNTADEYAQLKEKLAVTYKHDRDMYTKEKTNFIKKVITKARKEIMK